MVEFKVGQGFHIAGFHIHQDGAALLRLVVNHGVVECALHNVLQLDVEGGDEVVAILRVHVFLRVDGNPVVVV